MRPTKDQSTYTVVENSGYENQRNVWHTTRYEHAINWINKTYNDKERLTLHVEICKILPDGTETYDF